MSIEKKENTDGLFLLTHSLTTAHLFGCYTAEEIIIS